LAPLSVSVPVPAWVTIPAVPEMTPAKVMLSERLKVSVPVLATLPVIEPVVPPLPICRIPALMVVPPE
jgi:hypothetical protein